MINVTKSDLLEEKFWVESFKEHFMRSMHILISNRKAFVKNIERRVISINKAGNTINRMRSL